MHLAYPTTATSTAGAVSGGRVEALPAGLPTPSRTWDAGPPCVLLTAGQPNVPNLIRLSFIVTALICGCGQD